MVEPEATSFYSSKSHHIDMFSYCLVSQRLGIDHKEIPTLLHSGIYIGKEFFLRCHNYYSLYFLLS